MRVIGGIGLAVVLLAGALASPAAAGYRFVSDDVTSGDGTQEGNSVSCPGDEPVVGGGAFSNSTLNQRVELNTSRPVDDDDDDRLDDGWIVYGDNINSGDGISVGLRVFAVCDKSAKEGDYRYVS